MSILEKYRIAVKRKKPDKESEKLKSKKKKVKNFFFFEKVESEKLIISNPLD